MPAVDNEPLREQSAEDQVRTWQGRISLAERYLDEHGNTDGRWTKNVKALAGDFNSVQELGEEAIDVNMMRSTLKTILPPLTLNEPRISVRPTQRKFKGRDNIRAAELTQLEINHWLGELRVRETVKRVMIDAECTNHGYIYIGYVDDKSEVENEHGERTEPDPSMQPKLPFVKRHSSRRVLVPPGYDTLEAHPWVDLVFIRPLQAIKDRYPETTEDLQGSRNLEGGSQEDTKELQDYLQSADAQLVEIHNIWCKETKKVYILAKGHDQYLEEPEDWPWDVDGFPLAHYSPELIPDEFFGTPPMSSYLPQNKELNALRTAMRKRRNRTKQVIITKSGIADEFKAKYASAEDGEVIPLDLEDDSRIGDALMIVPGINIDNSDLAYDGMTKGDIREGSSLGAEQRGGGDPNIDSATASANVQQGANMRQADKADGVRTLYLDVARKLWMILRQNPNQKRERLVLGRSASEIIRAETYTLGELHGEFNFEMDFSTVISAGPQGLATQAILNYNLMRADPLVNPEALLFDILQSQNKIDPDRYLVFLRKPEEELQLMTQGLPVEAHERDDHMEHMAKHEVQLNGIEMTAEQLGPATPKGTKMRLTGALMIAHYQDHARKLQRLQGAGQGKPPGSPVAENMLRNQVRAGSGETAAELTGQPLNPADTVQ